MTNIPDHALPLILEYTQAIRAQLLNFDAETFDRLDVLTYSDNGGIDWVELELEEDSDEEKVLLTLKEVAIHLLDT